MLAATGTEVQLVDLYEKIFNREAELREFFDEEKITEGQFLLDTYLMMK